jgi:hypothetical protein
MMLRSIQQAAAGIAVFFGVGAFCDVIFLHAPLDGIILPLALQLSLPFAWIAPLAFALCVLPFGIFFSIRRSTLLAREREYVALDWWRRITWGLSILEAGGSFLFTFYGSLLFVPSAIALFIAGVAELGCIMHEIEYRPTYLPFMAPSHDRQRPA